MNTRDNDLIALTIIQAYQSSIFLLVTREEVIKFEP